MKSFADWTQELAESVGEVKHHWETEKAIEPRWQGYDSGDVVQEYAIPTPPQPQVPMAISYGPCDACGKINYLFVAGYMKLCAQCTPSSPPIGVQPTAPSAPLCDHCALSRSTGRWSSTHTSYDLCDICGTSFQFVKTSTYP